VDAITDTKLATVLGKRPNSISTIEHFLSAVYAYGIDNLKVTIYGNEMPVMDGSAISFCMLLDEAGIKKQELMKSLIVIKKEVKVEQNGKVASLKPAKRPIFNFLIDFDHPIIGKQKFKFEFSKAKYLEEIARARTFGFLRDIQYLQSINLALGASLENAIGLDDNSVLNPEGLRFEDEFVRHKILDAIGDMMVLGKQTKALLADEKAYEVVNFEELEESIELATVFAQGV